MHTGLFPEQRPQWQWMLDRAASIGRPISVLNLFAYTGGASLALAAAGHRVTHVDASTPAIAWARRNDGLNGLDTIRWLHDDVRAFVDRELRRERQYDGVVLDPPAFGRGSGGPWLLDRDLPDLLRGVNLLLSQARAFVLVNAYGGGVDASRLKTLCETALGVGARRGMEAGTLSLSDARRRLLPTSVFARV
jgi:23S rRNA (cytosine1962-C5)-methyltransferase